ncbi:unnamed protein product [Adineta steineri]|uniref:UDP-N-acetylglucosamine--peptide N-acetylglucosaminyltransferase SPINDLY n=1 Tax=Adineta steineri TaxID=433720 RepID=A0A815Q3V5_9BILA|nr:unnamed protein product [Adineta steineri]CAF3778957.1 unnamed protein product [Adineta steineri]
MGANQSKEVFEPVPGSSASNTPLTTTTTTPSIRQRIAQNYMLAWVDASIDQTNKDCQNKLTQLRAVVNNVTICTQPNECMQFFHKLNDEKVFVITSGSLGQYLVPEIHDMPNLDAIYIFCDNISDHQQWTKDRKKIKGVHNNMKDICDALKAAVKQVNQDSIPISFVTTNEVVSSNNLNQLEPNYMYTQIFKDILLEMEYDHKQAVKDLAMYYRRLYHDNTAQLKIIDEFEYNYCQEQAITWYTREYFTCQMLNCALRTLDADTIINMGVFIHDLHKQIVHLHEQQLPDYRGEPLVVYRGQGLSKTDFDKLIKTKGGLMSFDSFLSTTNDRNVSFMFADSALGDSNMMGILFIMTIDPRVSSAPFASINEISYFKAQEEEILFSMHTVFRIDAIKQIGNNDRLYEVELQLTADDDEQLRQLTNFISGEVGNARGLGRLGNLLLKTGHFDKAEELHKVLLEQPSNESDKGFYYNNLGTAKYHQGDYDQAIEYYEKALEIWEQTLPADHPSLATSYNNIGGVYVDMGEYSKALSFYEKALTIKEQTLPANHPSLATSYSNIGLVYYNMGEYSKALLFFEKALKIQEKILPSNHPDLATSYSNIGSVYNSIGEYSKALSYYEKALEIEEKTLPANHPSLATSYNNIGEAYMHTGKNSEALSFYEKALEIQEKTLPANHPSLATPYNNIGSVYMNMGEYLKALSFYEKAREIVEKTLPTNHHLLATSYSNIGGVYDNTGEYSKAFSFYEKALTIKEKTLPADHPSLATSYNNIGGVYADIREHSKALLFFEKALKIQEKTLPVYHPDLAASYNNTGSVYNSIGEYSKALSFFEKAHEIFEKTLPADHPSLATSYNNLGSLYYHTKEYSKALSYSKRALNILKASFPSNHPHLKSVKQSIKIVKKKL